MESNKNPFEIDDIDDVRPGGRLLGRGRIDV